MNSPDANLEPLLPMLVRQWQRSMTRGEPTRLFLQLRRFSKQVSECGILPSQFREETDWLLKPNEEFASSSLDMVRYYKRCQDAKGLSLPSIERVLLMQAAAESGVQDIERIMQARAEGFDRAVDEIERDLSSRRGADVHPYHLVPGDIANEIEEQDYLPRTVGIASRPVFTMIAHKCLRSSTKLCSHDGHTQFCVSVLFFHPRNDPFV